MCPQIQTTLHMQNNKNPFEFFDGDSLDALVSGPDAPQKIEAYMDSLIDHFKTSFKASLQLSKQEIAPTAPLDLEGLVPVKRPQSDPIWEKSKPSPQSSTSKAEEKIDAIPEYPPIPEIRPKRNRWGMIISENPEPAGTIVSESPNLEKKSVQAEIKMDISSPEEMSIKEEAPKAKKVNTEAIEKRFKDRQDKLGDLFKDRGQIS